MLHNQCFATWLLAHAHDPYFMVPSVTPCVRASHNMQHSPTSPYMRPQGPRLCPNSHTRGSPAPPTCMTCMSLAWSVRQHVCSHCATSQSRRASGCRAIFVSISPFLRNCSGTRQPHGLSRRPDALPRFCKQILSHHHVLYQPPSLQLQISSQSSPVVVPSKHPIPLSCSTHDSV